MKTYKPLLTVLPILLLLLCNCNKSKEITCQFDTHTIVDENKERFFIYNDDQDLMRIDEHENGGKASEIRFFYNNENQWVSEEKWFVATNGTPSPVYKGELEYADGKLSLIKAYTANSSIQPFALFQTLQLNYDGNQLSTFEYFSTGGKRSILVEVLERENGNITKSRRTRFAPNDLETILEVRNREFFYDEFEQHNFPSVEHLFSLDRFHWPGFSKNNVILTVTEIFDANGDLLNTERERRTLIYNPDNRVIGLRIDGEENFTFDCFEE